MTLLHVLAAELARVPVWAWWIIACLAGALWGALMQVHELTTSRASTTFAARAAVLVGAAAIGVLVPVYLWLAERFERELRDADPMTAPDSLDLERR